jgi:hypothetical protein
MKSAVFLIKCDKDDCPLFTSERMHVFENHRMISFKEGDDTTSCPKNHA